MSLYESLRIAVNRLGFDVRRVGRERLGRILSLDLDTLAKDPKIIFDVGANTGRAARFFLKRFRRANVYSFEPFQQSFDELRADVRLASVRPLTLGLVPKARRRFCIPSRGPSLILY